MKDEPFDPMKDCLIFTSGGEKTKDRSFVICCIGWFILAVAGFSNVAADTRADQFYKPPPGNLESTHAYISDAEVFSPLGKFLLIRKGTVGCVVRFTSFHREGKEEKKGTVFFSREPVRTAEVEWYYQGDGSFNFSKPNVVSGKASLRNTSSFGIGRLAFKPTATLGFHCGSISFGWYDGTHLGFSEMDGKWDFEREIAPSKWINLSEVDFSNLRLIWIKQAKYEAERQGVEKRFIPMNELP